MTCIICHASRRGSLVVIINRDNELRVYKVKRKGPFSVPLDTKLCFVDGILQINLPKGWEQL
jgi:hypothetical protein